MAKFKGGYKNEYALMLMAQYFKNTLVYYKGEVADDDYFDPDRLSLQRYGGREGDPFAI